MPVAAPADEGGTSMQGVQGGSLADHRPHDAEGVGRERARDGTGPEREGRDGARGGRERARGK